MDFQFTQKFAARQPNELYSVSHKYDMNTFIFPCQHPTPSAEHVS
jgi:hypothetical protein